MSIETGNYTVIFFDEKNSRVTNIKDKADSLSIGIERGERGKSTYENIHSFVVDRRIYNSLDKG